MWPNPQIFWSADPTFTEEILNGKLHFLYSEWFLKWRTRWKLSSIFYQRFWMKVLTFKKNVFTIKLFLSYNLLFVILNSHFLWENFLRQSSICAFFYQLVNFWFWLLFYFLTLWERVWYVLNCWRRVRGASRGEHKIGFYGMIIIIK